MSLTDNKVREIPVYWEWKLETGETAEEINDNDIEDSKFMGRTMSMQIAVVGKQVLERPKYTVTFDVNGGGTLTETTRTVDAEYELGTLPTLTRDGYIFDGWFTKSDGGSQIDENTKMQYGDVTYYAHWTEKIDYAKDTLVLTNNVSPYVNYVDRNGNTILCRVLYNDDENGLQIVSVNSVTTVTLGSEDSKFLNGTDNENALNSYNNAITTLNNYAEEYIDNKGIALDARCIGSNPIREKKNDEVIFTNQSSYTYLNSYKNNLKWTDDNYMYDWEQLIKIQAASSNSNYWLASRVIQSGKARTICRIRFITDYGALGSNPLWQTSGESNSFSYGFRPVFYINFNVKITGGTGTLDAPYEFGI